MAARGRILVATFISFAILPLLASALFPILSGIKFPGHDDDDSLRIFNPWKDQNEGGEGSDEGKEGSDKGKEGSDNGKEGSDKGSDKGNEGSDKAKEGSGGGGNGPEPVQEGLREGFYEKSCPQAEKIVNEVLTKQFSKNPRLAPAFVRLFFHDCFVTGCDASILLDNTPSGEDVEKKADQNGPFVRGYDAIDEIKTRLEEECPGVVSCADILAFTNRDSLVYTGVPRYNVAAGRRDGLSSLAENVDGNISYPNATAQENIKIFEKKGMTLEELVLLTGAHSIGTAHCTVVSGRFHDPEKSKDIDRGYLIKMQSLTYCRNDVQDLPFDPYSHHKMDSRYYKELLKNQALLESDHHLAKEPQANDVMKKYADDQNGWLENFTKAIIKLGEVEVLTGNQGEIRKQCRAVN